MYFDADFTFLSLCEADTETVVVVGVEGDLVESALRLGSDVLAAGDIPMVAMTGEGDAERVVMERFVASEFLQRYGACVKTFMPWLLGLYHHTELVGVAGLRPAGDEKLFIEQYLDRAIETEIAQHVGVPVARATVLEIGNLAGQIPGVTRTLFPLLTELIYRHGYAWSVCNTTPAVRNALRRVGIPFQVIARATPERLGAARFAWGSYYTQETVVIAISLPAAHAALLCRPTLAAACVQALAGVYDNLPAVA